MPRPGIPTVSIYVIRLVQLLELTEDALVLRWSSLCRFVSPLPISDGRLLDKYNRERSEYTPVRRGLSILFPMRLLLSTTTLDIPSCLNGERPYLAGAACV